MRAEKISGGAAEPSSDPVERPLDDESLPTFIDAKGGALTSAVDRQAKDMEPSP
jgi:hypothetical protein